MSADELPIESEPVATPKVGPEDPATEETSSTPPPSDTKSEEDDIESLTNELNDKVTADQRALLHQLMVDAAGLLKHGGTGFAMANSAVQSSGVNIHLGDNVMGTGYKFQIHTHLACYRTHRPIGPASRRGDVRQARLLRAASCAGGLETHRRRARVPWLRTDHPGAPVAPPAGCGAQA